MIRQFTLLILLKKDNVATKIFHIGKKTEMEYYYLLLMLDFLNVEYEVDEYWMEDQKGEFYEQLKNFRRDFCTN